MHGDHPVPLFHGDVLHRRRRRDSRVVDEDVDARVRGQRRRHQSIDVRLAADVRLHANRAAASTFDLLADTARRGSL